MHQTNSMDIARRRALARQVLEGYVSGPAAATEATVRALAKLTNAKAVVLVEGISDQIALETVAVRRDLDLAAERVVVLPIGGANAITRFLTRLGPGGADLTLAGLCDAGEEDVFRRGIARSGIASPQTRGDLERLGFYVCVEDLEDELIRANGAAEIEAVFESQGDLGSFRSMQRQPQWRGQPIEAQLRRFLASGSRRKLRYARLLVESLDLDRLPRPLDAVVTCALDLVQIDCEQDRGTYVESNL
ncbi:MAG TPA: TOPRIM nucleotidyl transferase/hydrolase domain-containing protein [Streptosporangiaceae bacterium]|nr:TOPRIM nucleotidyl transferase/hydrolase domain-containing protein [Streptosporangiaceae bacterium]